ncbi:MAG: TVP38/TMEM64 family protein [Chitinophagaceae bacterium]|nr:TVP38/TMEM64 family protein [Anaerolineae bacterium]
MNNPESKAGSRWVVVLPIASLFLMTLVVVVAVQAVGLERIQQAIAKAGPLAPIIYVVIRMSTLIISPLTSGPLQMTSGALFGPWAGLFYSLLADVLGGSLNFWIARKLGRPVVRRLVGEWGLQRIDQFYYQAGEVWSLIYARLFLTGLYDFISYAAGLSPLKYRDYFLVSTVVGIFPISITVFLGNSMTKIDDRLLIVVSMLSFLFVIPLALYPYLRRWFTQTPPILPKVKLDTDSSIIQDDPL